MIEKLIGEFIMAVDARPAAIRSALRIDRFGEHGNLSFALFPINSTSMLIFEVKMTKLSRWDYQQSKRTFQVLLIPFYAVEVFVTPHNSGLVR